MLIDRYIARLIIYAAAMIAMIMAGLLMLINLLGELKDLGDGDYGLVQAFFYTLLKLPQGLYQYSPMLLMLSVIIALSLLSQYRELLVMRVSGMSTLRIARGVLLAAVCLLLISVILGEVLGPRLSYRAIMNKENAKSAGQAVITAKGVWLHAGDNFIHIQDVIDRTFLQHVTRYEFDSQHQLKAAYYANTLILKNHRWQMQDGEVTYFYPQQTKSKSFATMSWDINFNPNLFTIGLVEPEEMSLSRIRHFIRYLIDNGLQATNYEFNYWQRVFQPLASLIMMLLVIPLIVSAFDRAGIGRQVILGILAGFGFVIVNALLSQLSIVLQFPPVLAALMPILILGGVGILLIK